MGMIGKILRSFIEDDIREVVTEIYEGFPKTSRQILPPGIDSAPLPDDQGVIISIDGTEGKTVQIGVYTDPSVQAGEIRIYSRDSDGAIKAELHLRPDGKHYFNSGSKKAARENDPIQSTAVEDSVFWAWIAAAGPILAGLGVTAPVPTSLTGKITDGTDEVLLP